MVNRESLHILVWSGEAFFAFCIISGFWMSLIVNEKYAKLPNGIRRFYANRTLRLYSVHWTILRLLAALCRAALIFRLALDHAGAPLLFNLT